jgi:integrase
MRQADGTIARVRIEESTRETGKAKASRVAADLAQYYHEQAYRPQLKASPSFTDAAITYVETKNPSERDRKFVSRLLAHFGDTPISDIDQAAVSNAAHVLYPRGKAATHVRAVFAPVTTVLRLSGHVPQFALPKIERSPKKIPPESWFDTVLRESPPRLGALLAFLTLTGRRITEALEATFNAETKEAIIVRSKSGKPVAVVVPDICLRLLADRLSDGEPLFGYGDRHNVYRELRAVCKKAKVPYYGTHSLGRHAAASRLLRLGYSTKFVAEALGWESTRMVDLHYGHLEQSEVRGHMRKVQVAWARGHPRGRKARNGHK